MNQIASKKHLLAYLLVLAAQFLFAHNIEVVVKLNTQDQLAIQKLTSLYSLKLNHKLFDDFYVFEVVNNNTGKRTKRESEPFDFLEAKLRSESLIQWHEFQTEVYRAKRSLELDYNDSNPFKFSKQMLQELNYYFHHRHKYLRQKSKPPPLLSTRGK